MNNNLASAIIFKKGLFDGRDMLVHRATFPLNIYSFVLKERQKAFEGYACTYRMGFGWLGRLVSSTGIFVLNPVLDIQAFEPSVQ